MVIKKKFHPPRCFADVSAASFEFLNPFLQVITISLDSFYYTYILSEIFVRSIGLCFYKVCRILKSPMGTSVSMSLSWQIFTQVHSLHFTVDLVDIYIYIALCTLTSFSSLSTLAWLRWSHMCEITWGGYIALPPS